MRVLILIVVLSLASCKNKNAEGSKDELKNQLLVGNWVLTQTNSAFANHPPDCFGLIEGSIYTFNELGKISLRGQNCYTDQFYWIKGDTLAFFEPKYSWKSKIEILSEKELQLRMHEVPSYLMWELYIGHGNNYWETPGYQFIKNEGILLTFRKI